MLSGTWEGGLPLLCLRMMTGRERGRTRVPLLRGVPGPFADSLASNRICGMTTLVRCHFTFFHYLLKVSAFLFAKSDTVLLSYKIPPGFRRPCGEKPVSHHTLRHCSTNSVNARGLISLTPYGVKTLFPVLMLPQPLAPNTRPSLIQNHTWCYGRPYFNNIRRLQLI